MCISSQTPPIQGTKMKCNSQEIDNCSPLFLNALITVKQLIGLALKSLWFNWVEIFHTKVFSRKMQFNGIEEAINSTERFYGKGVGRSLVPWLSSSLACPCWDICSALESGSSTASHRGRLTTSPIPLLVHWMDGWTVPFYLKCQDISEIQHCWAILYYETDFLFWPFFFKLNIWVHISEQLFQAISRWKQAPLHQYSFSSCLRVFSWSWKTEPCFLFLNESWDSRELNSNLKKNAEELTIHSKSSLGPPQPKAPTMTDSYMPSFLNYRIRKI